MKKMFKDTKLYFFVVISAIFFLNLLKMEYATDTYAVFCFDAKSIFQQFASSGRLVTACVGAMCKILNIRNDVMYICSFIIAFISIVFSEYKLYKIIKEDINDKLFQKIIPILIIVNIFSIELFLFIEKGIMIFAIMMCIVALDNFIKSLKFKSKKNLLYAVISMMIATCSYQGVVGIFVAISMIYILKYSDSIKSFIKNNVIVALIYGIPAILDYVFVKILYSSSRINGKIIFKETINKIILSTQDMIKFTYRLLPKNFFITVITLIIIICVYEIIRNKKDLKLKFIEIGKIIYIIFGLLIVTVLPQMVQNTQSIWFVPRSTYVFASTFGILMLYLFMNFDISIIIKNIVLIVSAVLLFLQLYKFNIIEIDRYKLNAIDFEISKNICEQIQEYEEKFKIEIKNIVLYKDKSSGYTYENIFATGDTNVKAYSNDWSCKAILDYYSKKKLSIGRKNTEIENFFKEKDWNTFNLEQLKFEGDTLHICCY